MAKRNEFKILESLQELQKLHKKQTSVKTIKRSLWLLEFASTSEKLKRIDTAKKAGITIKTQERWIKEYTTEGIEKFLSPKTIPRTSKIITKEIHEGLSKRLNSPSTPFLGYWDACNWVEQTYGVKINYQTLRCYLKKHFQSKLKVPRKSHVKKDDQAIEAFLKTT